MQQAIKNIKRDMNARAEFTDQGKLLEAQRLQQRYFEFDPNARRDGHLQGD